MLLERDLHQVHAEQLVRGDAFHAGVQSAAEEQGKTIACSPSCSACCSHPVMVSLLEGLLLFRWIAERGQWTTELRDRLLRHAGETWGLAHEVWFLSNIPCPFLDANRCSAHEARPFICRATWSVGDPYDCHPHRFGPRTGIVPRAEVVGDFHRLEERKLREHGLTNLRLPLSKAVLLAEAILSEKLALNAVGAALAKEYEATG